MDYSVEQEFKRVWGALKCKASCSSIVNAGWALTGNAGTDPSINFIGTTDKKHVIFRQNNKFSGILDDDFTSFGVNAGENKTTGNTNSAFGTTALQILTTASNNTAIGASALTNVNADNNTAVGFFSGNILTTGANNTCIGNNATTITNATNNSIALGYGAVAKTNQFAIQDTITEVKFKGLQAFANNAAALLGGLDVGSLYYTNVAGDGIIKIVI